MDRGAWQAIVHGVARVGHDLGTKPPLPLISKVGLEIPWMFTSFFLQVRLSQDHLIFIMCTVLSQMSRVCSDVHSKCYGLFLFWNKRFLYIVNPKSVFLSSAHKRRGKSIHNAFLGKRRRQQLNSVVWGLISGPSSIRHPFFIHSLFIHSLFQLRIYYILYFLLVSIFRLC